METVKTAEVAVSVLSTVSGSLGRYVLAAIAGMAVVASLLGLYAIRDWHGSIAEAATATCRLDDLRASETARARLQARLDALGAEMTATAQSLTEAESRRAAAVAALTARPATTTEKACRVDLRSLKKLN
jgi:hypothetical protein